ncbi:unnamed protein product [Paramecium sonneborni]|uniref:Uncharacterized protein n=1 Tax=Paramecium sonneborni TaxID=65129 RepID=A0A8S1QYI6_9CILI|nr:unnamed protein product [Paramecium sonneborni]
MNTEISRAELLQWVNDTLKLSLQKIEQLGTGAVYCQLIDAVHPGKVVLNKINWKAKQEYEFVNNFKVLQQAFSKLGIQKPIEIEKLTKCKYQDNLEFLQWLKKYMDQHVVPKDYDPQAKRGNAELDDQPAIVPKRNPERSRTSIKKDIFNSPNQLQSQISIPKTNSFAHMEPYQKKQPSMQDLLIQIETLKQEKEYYFQKFKDLDFFIEGASQLTQEQMYKGIRDILYFTADKSVIVLPNGELEVQGLPPSSEEQSLSQEVMQQEIDL